MASIQVVGKDGTTLNSVHTTRLEKVQLKHGETISWVEVFYAFDSSSWGFRDHIIRHGNAVANVHIRNSQNGCGPEVYVRIEGYSSKDVGVLVEEVLKMMGGKIVEFRPVRSWFTRVRDAWKEWQQEVRAGMDTN